MMQAQTLHPEWLKAASAKAVTQLVQKYGASQEANIKIGIGQVSDFWYTEDGTEKEFTDFVLENYAGDPVVRDAMFNRFEYLFEKLDGHMQEITREFRVQSDLDLGIIYPFDELFGAYNAAAHTTDDFFQNKIAFVVLLNFKLHSLEEKISLGDRWTRPEWAELRLAERFSKRIPANVYQEVSKASSEAELYIAGYNVFMHNVTGPMGEKPFPKGLRLLSHWNLRDEIKADYANGSDGLLKQQIIYKVMERIVDQTIPKAIIDNPNYEWNPFTNAIKPAAEIDPAYPVEKNQAMLEQREPDTRYKVLLNDFLAVKKIDPYSPTAPTHILRKFNEERELPEERVKKIFEDILSSPMALEVAARIKKQVGRELTPFDIWYNGFVPRNTYTEAQLDEIVRKRYPTPEAYKKDIPNLLQGLGFSPERATFLANNIMVDPARGSGHAMGASMREAKARLRTRVGKDGMDYKGFNIAVHEMGHNVEQTFSLNLIDHTLLQGVPNTAFTEALAFVFQNQDLKLLGLSTPDEKTLALKIINDYWMSFEIAGVALVDMEVWHWMYAHPDASPAQLREATLSIAKGIWNTYYFPVLGNKDATVLGIYSHMIHSFLYLPDYPLGHTIAFQIEEQIKKKGAIGPEFERVAVQGRIAPDLWMKTASGMPVGAEALLQATRAALDKTK
jgi:hypothetical protein